MQILHKPLLFATTLFLLLTIACCKDDCQDPRNSDCENYNPCIDAKATSAAFTIKEATYAQIIEPRLADFLIDTDSVYFSSVYFEATQADADSFIWQVGSEIEPRYGKQINVQFPDNLRGTTFNVRLIVKRKPNTACFPNDDGMDTLNRKFYFVRFNEPLSWEGTYYGSDDDKPDSMYTIVLGHGYDTNKEEDILKIYGIPRGCKDTVNQWISNRFITYKNVSFRKTGYYCDGKTMQNIVRNNNQYIISYSVATWENNTDKRVDKLFRGFKIN